jgi:proteasome lid subunit RPN8/RPN11
MTVRLAPALLREIVDASETAFPDEACGLLVGRRDGEAVLVTEVHTSSNLAEEPGRAFEVDPALRLALHKRLRGSADSVVGVYHSHPGHSAQPSRADLMRAWEPELVWLITSVLDGQAVLTTAHSLVDDGTRFARVPLCTDDWGADPTRDPIPWPGMR